MRNDELFEAFSDIDQYYLNEGIPYTRRRRRLSKSGLLICLFASLFLAIGCFWYLRIHSCGFHLKIHNGEYYLEDNAPYTFDQHMGNSALDHHIAFQSLNEMRTDFFTYNFTDDEILSIGQFMQENNGRVRLPNLRNLYEPICPDDVTYQGIIQWNGSEEYSFQVTSPLAKELTIVATSRRTYEHAENRMLEHTVNTDSQIISEKQIEDRNATLYVLYSAITGEISTVLVYSIKEKNKTVIVEEFYTGMQPEEIYSDTVSSYLSLYIQDDDCYGFIYMKEYSTRPTTQWLCAFGFQKGA